MPGCWRSIGRVKMCNRGNTEHMRLVNICTGKVTKTQSWRRKRSCLHTFTEVLMESLMVWCMRTCYCSRHKINSPVLKCRRILMKMDQCYSFTDSHTQCTAQPIPCIASLSIATAVWHGHRRRRSPRHLETTMVSGEERGRDTKGREGKEEGDGESKRNGHGDKENEGQKEEEDHK